MINQTNYNKVIIQSKKICAHISEVDEPPFFSVSTGYDFGSNPVSRLRNPGVHSYYWKILFIYIIQYGIMNE